jgi:hypothetical protein
MRYAVAMLLLVSCAVAGVTSDNLDYSLLDIQKAIGGVVPVGIQQQESERVFDSKYFRLPYSKKIEPVRKDDQARGAAQFRVLGDRRPYNVEVRVITEEKDSKGEWSDNGQDQGLARVLAVQIQDYLAKHKEKNLIDHFRAF